MSWDFLDSIIEQMEFGWRWCRWIMGYLSSSGAYVLVNGSPTWNLISKGELDALLSPFLYIISMVRLHGSMEAVMIFVISGVYLFFIMTFFFLSHLMYVDDVTFICEWSKFNIINLHRLLCCFHLALGLKVNLHKSKVYGVGVDILEVERLASILKCEPSSFLFIYFGLPVGANMRLAKNFLRLYINLRQSYLNGKRELCISVAS